MDVDCKVSRSHLCREAESRWWRGKKQSPVSSCRGCSLDTGGGSPTTMGDQVPRWGRRGGEVKKSSLSLSSGAPSVLMSPLQVQALPMEALQAQERKRRKNCAGCGYVPPVWKSGKLPGVLPCTQPGGASWGAKPDPLYLEA